MTLRYVIVQQPPKVAQLFLLYHAVGDNPDAMGEIGSWFAKTFLRRWSCRWDRRGLAVNGLVRPDFMIKASSSALTPVCRSLLSPFVTGSSRAA